jgi:hypothetical protein
MEKEFATRSLKLFIHTIFIARSTTVSSSKSHKHTPLYSTTAPSSHSLTFSIRSGQWSQRTLDLQPSSPKQDIEISFQKFFKWQFKQIPSTINRLLCTRGFQLRLHLIHIQQNQSTLIHICNLIEIFLNLSFYFVSPCLFCHHN